MIKNYTYKSFAFFGILVLLFFQNSLFSQEVVTDSVTLNHQNQNNWWIGVINHGHNMPISNGYQANMFSNNYGNQIQPLVISSEGEYIWSEHPISIDYINNSLKVKSFGGKLYHSDQNSNLRKAYLEVSQKFFPPTGKLPDLDLVRYPQYNTWIELMYDQNQEDILKYANAIIANGFPPGVIMVDDNWQEDYGNWKFHPARFPNPKEMMDSLHSMGFKVMLWVCPFVSPDSRIHRNLAENNFLLKNESGNAAMIDWWNGTSSCLDFSNPGANSWFNKKLTTLTEIYRVDGFKFDAGDAQRYNDIVSYKPIGPNEHSRLFGLFGLDFPLNEYRAMWKMGGQPLVQRLRDKGHNWEDMQKLIPHILLQGLMGYAFTCPDMIGGGEYRSFLNSSTIDQELIVRSAQCHALMPMMQFSVAPWRVLDEKHLKACKKAVQCRQKYTPVILDLIKEAARTGEPVVRSLEYVFPKLGYEKINDQFMLGNNIMICPVMHKNAEKRKIILPPGNWKLEDGAVYKGFRRIEVKVDINTLPVFIKE